MEFFLGFIVGVAVTALGIYLLVAWLFRKELR